MKHFFLKLGAWLSVAGASFVPLRVFAQLTGPDDANSDLAKIKGVIQAESPTDLPTFIGGLINAFLSVLGIIFVVMTVYAGYLWMTANGETAKTEKAKTLLGQAIIGMIIILAAYAISAFVIGRLIDAAR